MPLTFDWDRVRIFHAVAEAGSFTRAADRLGLSQSAISRQIGALEEHLGIALFHRHARGLVLTEQGELLYRTVSEVLNKLLMVETQLSDSTAKPSGELRITSPIGLGTVWLTQRLKDFMDLYPEIRVDLTLNDDQIDISMRAADCAIWTREPENADLIRRPLFTMHVHACASTAYVRKHGAPQTLADLDKHRIVSYSGHPAQHLSATLWLDTVGREGMPPREPAFRVNSALAMKHAIMAGIGIGMIPDYMMEGEGDVITVLNEIEAPKLPILFVYPEELKASKKVQVLRDFLVSRARQWKP